MKYKKKSMLTLLHFYILPHSTMIWVQDVHLPSSIYFHQKHLLILPSQHNEIEYSVHLLLHFFLVFLKKKAVWLLLRYRCISLLEFADNYNYIVSDKIQKEDILINPVQSEKINYQIMDKDLGKRTPKERYNYIIFF